jgi:hypothetical protein
MRSFIKYFITYLEASVVRLVGYNFQSVIFYITRGYYTYSNFKMYHEASSLLRLQGIGGGVFEFGVGSGMTASLLSISIRNSFKKNLPMYLFDTFEGMPKADKVDENFQWVTGNWAFTKDKVLSRLKSYGVNQRDVNFFQGDFVDSTKSLLAINALTQKALIVHIDCDYKLSALVALQYVLPALQNGTVILCDDYYCYAGDPTLGEAGAISEWSKLNNISMRPWKPYSLHGHSFIIYGMDK